MPDSYNKGGIHPITEKDKKHFISREKWEERFDEEYGNTSFSEPTPLKETMAFRNMKRFIQSELDAAREEEQSGFDDRLAGVVLVARNEERQRIINLLEEQFVAAKNPEFKAGIAHAQNLIKES